MSLRETFLIIARRWRLSIPAFILALALGAGVSFLVHPSYVAEQQMLVLASPTTAGIKEPTNPYLNFGATLVSTAGVIALTVSTPQTVQKLAAEGASATYEVTSDTSTPAPVILIKATDPNPAVAARTVHLVGDEFSRLLAQAQRSAGAPEKTWVRTSVLFSSPQPRIQRKQQIRAMIVVFTGAVAATLIGLFLLEGRAQRRSRREQAAGPVSQWPESASTPDSPKITARQNHHPVNEPHPLAVPPAFSGRPAARED